MISLFTLSAAVMPYFDGKKKYAVTLFLQTVAVFAGLTAVALALLFSGVGR